tara:strand:- start:7366 stop:8253 length:888 start_codon:yes stop_codon:yes gene_type:complete
MNDTSSTVKVSDMQAFAAAMPIHQNPGDKELSTQTNQGAYQGPPSQVGEVQQAPQEQQVQPRQDEAQAAPQPDDTPRIPKARLDQELAAKKRLREEMDTAQTELAELREKLRKAEFEKEIQELSTGQGRPSDWEALSMDEQDAWRFKRQAELVRKMTSQNESAPSGESNELSRRLDRLEFQTTLGLPAEQSGVIADLRDQTGITEISELKTLAAMRYPQLFSVGGGDTGSPAQFQQSPGRTMAPPQQTQGPTLDGSVTDLMSAGPGLDSDRAGASLIQQLAVGGGLIFKPKEFSP